MVQHAGGRDHDVDLVVVPGSRSSSCQRPFANVQLVDLVAEADALDHVVLAGDALEVRAGSRGRARTGGSSRA